MLILCGIPEAQDCLSGYSLGVRICVDRGRGILQQYDLFLPTLDTWLLTVLNSPLIWWFSWRTAQHAKDEALRFFSQFVEALPIAAPSASDEVVARRITSKLVEATDERARIRSLLTDWLKVEHGVVKLPRRLDDLSPFSRGAYRRSPQSPREEETSVSGCPKKYPRGTRSDARTFSGTPARSRAA